MDDADEIFERYASDPDITRYLAWPMHKSVDDTRAFLEWSDAEWQRWPAGPYLICAPETGRVLGGTGLAFETPFHATTGYVLARDAWGQGFATEALLAMKKVAADLGVKRLYAMCFPEHKPSRRVLEKGGFELEGILHRYFEFPNFHPGKADDVVNYVWIAPDK